MRNTTGDDCLPRVPRRSGEGRLFGVPRLEELADDPRVAGVLDAHTTDLLELTAITALTALRRRKLALAAERKQAGAARLPDRLIKSKEVAIRLGMGVDWVYRHKHELPFLVRLGAVPRFSEGRLEDYIRKRRGG
jgi:predicted DNA-binding transcriptional regulator AlpA